MKILIIGGTGTIGKKVSEHFSKKHEVIIGGRKSGDVIVDIADIKSIQEMFESVGSVGAVVCIAGDAKWAAFESMNEDDFYIGLRSKLMGQVNLVRFGRRHLNDGGVFIITTGILAHSPNAATVMLTMINRGLEAFVEAAALDMPRNQRLNAVCPPMAKETADKMGWGPGGLPTSEIAKYYLQSVNSGLNGALFGPTHSN